MKKHPAVDLKAIGGDKNSQADTDIQNSEASYRSLFDAIGSAALIIDPDTTSILHANPAACKFYGYSHDKLIQLKILDLAAVPPEDVWQRNRKIIAGELTHMTLQHRLAGGEIRDVDVDLGRGIFNGQAVNIATVRDVTEQKQAQQKLQESETQLHAVITAMSEGVVVQIASGEIVFCNPQAESILGLTADQMMGRTSTNPSWRSVHEDGSPFPGEEHPAMVSLRTGKPCVDVIMGVHLPDGGLRWISINSQPIFMNLPNQPSAVVATFVDVTERKQIDQTLRDSEEKFHAIIDAAKEGVILVDEQGIIIEWNVAQELLTGMRRENVIGRPAWEVQYEMTSPEGRKLFTLDMIKQMILNLVETGQVLYLDKPMEREIFTASGDKKITLQHAFAIPTSRGYRLCTFLHDITERKKTEEELKLFKSIIETSSEAIAISALEGQLVYINPAHEKLFGRTLEQARNTPYRDFYPLESIESINTVVAPALAHGESWEGELDAYNSAGDLFPLWERADSIRDSDGKMLYAFGLMHDVSERKQKEAALRESEARFREVLENSLDASYKRNLKTDTYEYLSPVFARITGYTPDEFENLPTESILNIMHADDMPQIERVIAESMSGAEGTAYQVEYRFKHKDGQYRWLQDQFTVMRDAQGNPAARIGSVSDITQRKQVEDALQAVHEELEKRVQERTIELSAANISLDKALRAKDEFMSAMSHELRTPLTGILGMVETLQLFTYGELNLKQLNSIRFIEQSGRRLLDIVNNVLDFTRLQSSTLKLGMRPCSLNYICQSALKKNAPLILQKKQCTSLVVTPPELILQSDEHSLYKMLQHLLDNAAKFTPDGGEFGIEVFGRADEKQVDITVWDTGIGIVEADFPRLFQPFVQLDARLARQYEGAGLGLALAKKKAELLGGDIKVESVVGKGSRFTVTLPWK